MNKEQLIEKIKKELGDVFTDIGLNMIYQVSEQYAQSQTESLKKEIEELRKVNTIKEFLESRLVVGVKIKLGRNCAEAIFSEEGEILELVEGHFEYDNGLYTETQTAPAIWDEEAKEFHSIYHLFENDLSGFMDSEILTT